MCFAEPPLAPEKAGFLTQQFVRIIAFSLCSVKACSASNGEHSQAALAWPALQDADVAGDDAQVSQIIAPAVLAVYALNLSRISVMDTATLLFGYFLAEKLEPPSLFWGFIATLVAAVYYGYGRAPQTDQSRLRRTV